ncbi:tyrosine-type recombinase/integrase [Streptomyces sp. NP160]|uniref:tyrosine-type recombinase/integrase n=1 Tax=Streptomyces sp. NP160 TaxID=2586637 RepID=UPI0035A6AD4E
MLPVAAVRALETYLGGRTNGPVFLTDDGTQRWGYAHAARLLGRLFTAAGVSAEVTAHSFRHAYATQALGMGVPLQDVQDAMGHADPPTTRRYDRGPGAPGPLSQRPPGRRPAWLSLHKPGPGAGCRTAARAVTAPSTSTTGIGHWSV